MITNYQKWQHPTDFKMERTESIFPEKMSSDDFFLLMTTKEQHENCSSSLQHKTNSSQKIFIFIF